ncbi:BH3-interacting domain death agonist [Alligator sinensis]|uniref:BH3-interacting domain death agonist n=1 Tax=Alligator sinensis TaxID=38654 RepID=A0A1U8CZB5_ALLSI|nr:BH3-interacting domain death agonist [Alligator sinensis]XP_014373364.1 BH3-interacting domain death agonist [Alligator sinensis]XP_014373367.1 BH3-interacting domain death agonist [Alligator sinensis]XP_014373368.1 BH3-interacting domain death agonist [Alligator sinensis]XP_025054587.1 BH3-interacting domain death agonist [Alligator sinensis]XP_025054588.1 BH3-interacting domain death agonist [Alligator sinensis]
MDQGTYSDGFSQLESLLLYSFLDNSQDCAFKEKLQTLSCRHTPQCVPHRTAFHSFSDDGELQTDGNRSGHFQNGEPGSETGEIYQIIGAQLAEIGDQLAAEMQAGPVDDLVQQFLNANLSSEEITRCLSQMVEQVLKSIPLDMDQEKAKLVLAMVLAKKVVNNVPSLLHRVFSTTVNYMNQYLHDYIHNIV